MPRPKPGSTRTRSPHGVRQTPLTPATEGEDPLQTPLPRSPCRRAGEPRGWGQTRPPGSLSQPSRGGGTDRAHKGTCPQGQEAAHAWPRGSHISARRPRQSPPFPVAICSLRAGGWRRARFTAGEFPPPGKYLGKGCDGHTGRWRGAAPERSEDHEARAWDEPAARPSTWWLASHGVAEALAGSTRPRSPVPGSAGGRPEPRACPPPSSYGDCAAAAGARTARREPHRGSRARLGPPRRLGPDARSSGSAGPSLDTKGPSPSAWTRTQHPTQRSAARPRGESRRHTLSPAGAGTRPHPREDTRPPGFSAGARGARPGETDEPAATSGDRRHHSARQTPSEGHDVFETSIPGRNRPQR